MTDLFWATATAVLTILAGETAVTGDLARVIVEPPPGCLAPVTEMALVSGDAVAAADGSWVLGRTAHVRYITTCLGERMRDEPLAGDIIFTPGHL